jgi:hypothetical protein
MIPLGLMNQKLAPGIEELSDPSMSEDFCKVNVLVPPVTRLMTFVIGTATLPTVGDVNVTLSCAGTTRPLADGPGRSMLNTLKL